MPSAVMGPLAIRLRRAGYSPHLFGYRGRSPLDGNVTRLARFVRESLGARPAHFIGHSLGGVVILEMLNTHPDIPVASAVLLGSPVRGCFAGRRLGGAQVGRWMMGASEEICAEREARWQRKAPLGVIAGTLPIGLGRAFGPLPSASDGVVCVEETRVDGMTAQVLVPTGHSLLIVSGAVGGLVERFLDAGSFQ
jgi:pimeloyl-ACP methyl ester carboxylesterase